MVEWVLRPGDSRVEAYFLGANKRSRHWFLLECTVNDLSAWATRYLSTRAVGMVDKGLVEIEEAALLLLKCAWNYERDKWSTPRYLLVSDDGLVDMLVVEKIAVSVWPQSIG